MSRWLDEALLLDRNDPLASIKNQFQLNPEEVYLDGNSLGALPCSLPEKINNTLRFEWGERQIRSWNETWIDLPTQTGAKIAPIIGARPEDVICADSVSVNLFKLAAASLSATPDRNVILSVKDMFPTDLYIAQGVQHLLGQDRCEVKLCEMSKLAASLDQHINVVILSQVNFRTGEAYDIAAITKQIHACGARVIWDVSHGVGVLPINAGDIPVDYIVGCGYKFLNGGPGAPAFVYIRPDLQQEFQQPLSGWMGHKNPFAFYNKYEPADGIDRVLAGTPNILSLVSLNAALDIYQDIDLEQLFDKAQALTQFFVRCVQNEPSLQAFEIELPDARGAQVSLRHKAAFAITQALIQKGVIGDFRSPDIARFGFAPLYTSFEEVAKAIETLSHILENKTYQQPEFQVSDKVT